MRSDKTANEVSARANAFGGSKRELRAIIIIMSLVIVGFFALAGRCYYLQHDLGDYYAEKCIIQQRAYLPLEPQRGAILDTRGRVLAASSQIRTIFAEPRIIKEPKETSTHLSPILDMGAHEICRLIVDSNNPGYAVLKTDASIAECDEARKIQGIGIQYDWRRQYPTGRLAAHIVGFTSKDNHGLAGVEYAFDRDLRGRGAKHTFLVDVHRRPLAFCLADEQDDNETPIHGAGIILTLDATIQQFAREALMTQYKAFDAEAAIAMVADPHTGEILAMVTLPDFDPADTAKTAQTHPEYFTNRLLTDQYEPGSIIKPIVAAIALDTKVMNRYETIFCENGRYHDKGIGTITEYHYHRFGDLTLREILMHSSNIGMAKIGQRLGATRLYEGLTLFGFGRKVGIELPGEAEGLLRPPDKWTGYSITRIPFGQEISVTGLQMLRAFCMLANGGHLVHPYMVKSLVRSDGMVIDMKPSTLRVGYVIKPDVAKWVIQDAMTAVVNDPKGTGAKAKLDKWTVFGKTGTAQLAREDGRGYEDKAYVASFIAGAPASNPRVVVLISIRRPNVALKKGYTGGTVAAPAAAVILEKTLTYLGVPPEGTPEAAAAAARSAQSSSDEEYDNTW